MNTTRRRSGETLQGRATVHDTHGNKFGDVVCDMIRSFRHDENELASRVLDSRIELDCDTPRVRIVSNTPEGQTETVYGVSPMKWHDVAVLKSFTISGRCIGQLAVGLYFSNWTTNDIAEPA